MNTRLLRFIAAGLAALLLLSGCGSAPAAASPTPTPASSGPAAAVIAEGRIVPRDSANLYIRAPGIVERVPVSEGQAVTKGTVLLRMGDRDAYQAAVDSAQSAVTSAQQALDRLTRTETLAYHQALLDRAAAQTAYNAALKAWNAFDQDQYDRDLDSAKSSVATELSDLNDAQTEFDKYADRDKDNSDRVRTRNALETAQTNYDNAVIHQTEVENRFLQVKSNLEVARGRLAEAARLVQQREKGPDADQLAEAQANLTAARSNLAAAQSALEDLDVVAPYDGVVAQITVSAGEEALPGAPVIVFAALGDWYVETTDLTERDVVNIQAGQAVEVVPDALPELTLTGTVERIRLTYAEKAGDVVYPVRIQLDPTDAELYWGMTVTVRFLQK
jgi:multidrug efflux pump subunit AcrA (membrane-fusion protein)